MRKIYLVMFIRIYVGVTKWGKFEKRSLLFWINCFLLFTPVNFSFVDLNDEVISLNMSIDY